MNNSMKCIRGNGAPECIFHNVHKTLYSYNLFNQGGAHFLMFSASQLQGKDHTQRGIISIPHFFITW